VLLILAGAVIGAAFSLASSLIVRWRDRVRERRTEMYLDALPAARRLANRHDILGPGRAAFERLHRLAVASSTHDARYTRQVMMHLYRLDASGRARHDASTGDNKDPGFRSASADFQAVLDEAEAEIRRILQEYEGELERLLRHLV
jgi:hypothetical protein